MKKLIKKDFNDKCIWAKYRIYRYLKCSSKLGKEIIYEIGTEEQSGNTSLFDQNEYMINEIYKFCDLNSIPKPLFIVLQTGTALVVAISLLD